MNRLIMLIAAGLLVCGSAACGGGGGTSPVGWSGPKTSFETCDLVITEIMGNPSSPVTGRRWVEIYNASGEEIDTTRLELRLVKGDSISTTSFRKAQLVLPAGEFLWIRLGAEPLDLELTAMIKVVESDKSLAIPEDNFELAIMAMGGFTIHKVTFGDKDGICDPATGMLIPPDQATDQALALKPEYFNCLAASTDCNAWGVANVEAIPGDTGFGTPGAGPSGGDGGGFGEKPPVPGEVALSEVMWQSGEETGDADWIELVSLADEWVNLAGCVLGDGTQSGDHTIASGVILCPGEMAVLSSDDLAVVGVETDYVFGGKPNLNKSGDRVYLKCPGPQGEMAVIFDLDFTSSGPFDLDPEGASVQVCPDKIPASPSADDYHNPAVWSVTPPGNTVGSSSDMGTPGLANVSCGGEPPQECEPPCAAGSICTMIDGSPVCAGLPLPGDLVVTEFMVNGSEVCSAKKDWVELHNLSSESLVLTGCTVEDDNAKPATVSGSAVIKPGGFLVMVQDSDGCMLGEAEVYCFGSNPNLNSGDDSFILKCDGQVVVNFNYGQADEPGKPDNGADGNRVAMQLAMGAVQVTPEFAADDANWCLAKTAMACGDLGTPGAVNDSCGTGPVEDCAPPCTGEFTCVAHPVAGNVCARPPAAQDVLPTEIMTNGADDCSGGKDWFELINLTGHYIEVGGCELSDDNDSTYAIKDSVVLAPGEYLVMVQGAAGCAMAAPRHYCFGGSPNLNTGDDSISLVCGGTTIFEVNYGEGDEIPEPDDPGGTKASTAVDPGAMDASWILNPANWALSCDMHACGEFASPGVANPACK
jgi:hypothetical protein